MSRWILSVLIFFSLIEYINSFACACSCCTGTGCSVSYLGTVPVSTCNSTTCASACQSTYTTCSSGSINAYCGTTRIFNIYSNMILISMTIGFILLNKN